MIEHLTNYLSAHFSYAIGWTIIHSIWQVSLIALIMSAIHRVHRNKTSVFKYNVSALSMIAVLITSLITFSICYFSNSKDIQAINIVIAGQLNTTITDSQNHSLPTIFQFFSDHIEHISNIWIVGVMLFIIKFLISYLYANHIKKSGIELLNPDVECIIKKVRAMMQMDKIVLFAESQLVSVPMVIGYFKPMVLFPIGMINMLSPDEIEAIIVHELSHIKRNDYIANIALSLVEILFYFHPAMWWMSANVKAERENCCDDAALNYNVDSITYAKALVKLEEFRRSGIPALAMPFTNNKHHLLNRVKRILNMEQTKNDIREKSVATILLIFVAILFASNTEAPSNISTSDTYKSVTSTPIDTIELLGRDEILLEVDKGIISSMEVDDKEVENDELLQLKGSPTLNIQDKTLLFHSDEFHFNIDPLYNHNTKRQQQDTFPQNLFIDKNKAKIIAESDGQKIEVEKENGKITGLKIDGEDIPESDFDKYQDQIDAVTKNFKYKNGDYNVFEFDSDSAIAFFPKNIDSIFSNSFGMMFDGENWKQFGGNAQQYLDEDVLEKLKNIEGFRLSDRFPELELDKLQELKIFENLEDMEGLESLEDLEPLFQQLGVELDSTMKLLKFDSDDFENFKGFEGFDFFSDENMIIRRDNERYGDKTVVDEIGTALNKDGLLDEYKTNKIEISGKHLKINGEKMPKALFNKYKNIYQESTGAPLTKNSKMIFEIEGEPSKRKVRSF